jgi:hypothetical protein
MQKNAVPDFVRVFDHHKWVHERLVNWARWVTPQTSSKVSPMFRDYRSHAWQWHPREHRVACDIIEAQKVERLVGQLPPLHRYALRWCYVYRYSPARAVRFMRVDYQGLGRHVSDARSMVDLALRGSDRWQDAVLQDMLRIQGGTSHEKDNDGPDGQLAAVARV